MDGTDGDGRAAADEVEGDRTDGDGRATDDVEVDGADGGRRPQTTEESLWSMADDGRWRQTTTDGQGVGRMDEGRRAGGRWSESVK